MEAVLQSLRLDLMWRVLYVSGITQVRITESWWNQHMKMTLQWRTVLMQDFILLIIQLWHQTSIRVVYSIIEMWMVWKITRVFMNSRPDVPDVDIPMTLMEILYGFIQTLRQREVHLQLKLIMYTTPVQLRFHPVLDMDGHWAVCRSLSQQALQIIHMSILMQMEQSIIFIKTLQMAEN